MKFYLRFVSCLLLTLLPSLAIGALSELDKSLYTQRTGVTNPGWEAGVSGWTASDGTYTTTTTAANIGSGNASGSWDSSSASQTLTSTSFTITSGDGRSSQGMVATCRFKAASGTATHTISAYDGSTLASQTISSSTSGFVRTSVSFTAPASGSVSIRITSVNSNEPTIYIDDCYIGTTEGFTSSNTVVAQYSGITHVNTHVEKSGSYTLTDADETAVFTADATAGLPAAASVPGKIYFIWASGANTDVTVDPNSSETVCGRTTIVVRASGDNVIIQSTGTTWIGLGTSCTREDFITVTSGDCTSGTCSPNTVSSGFASIAHTGSTGAYSASWVSGVCASQPSCSIQTARGGDSDCNINGSPSTSSVPISCYISSTGAAQNSRPMLRCSCPR